MSEDRDKPIAYALLFKDELTRLGPSLKRVFPIPEDESFDELLAKLDRAAVHNEEG